MVIKLWRYQKAASASQEASPLLEYLASGECIALNARSSHPQYHMYGVANQHLGQEHARGAEIERFGKIMPKRVLSTRQSDDVDSRASRTTGYVLHTTGVRSCTAFTAK